MKKLLSLLLVISLLTLTLASCSLFNKKQKDAKDRIKIAYMNGPTGMGIAKLISDNGGVNGNEKYEFIKYNDAALATADLMSGKIDLACLPTNTAATIYNKNQNTSVLAINCLNSLYLMTKTGVQITSLSELEGKTIYTIQNGTPATILKHLLEKNGINANVVTSTGEGSEKKDIVTPQDLLAKLVEGTPEIALVPEPVATAAPIKIKSTGAEFNYSVALNLSSEWAKISDSPIAMGCIVANNEILKERKADIDAFLEEYKASIGFISNLENIDASAQMIVDAGVLDAVPIAKQSLTKTGSAIAYIDGAEMKSVLVNFYNAIGIKLTGGKLPDDKFYYEK